MNFCLKPALFICLLTLSVSILRSQSASPNSKQVLIAEVLKKFELDTLSTLLSRVKETPPDVKQSIGQSGKIPLVKYVLNEAERKQIARAFSMLPQVYLNILKAHVRSISFIDSTVYRALTFTGNRANYGIYDIVINANTLSQDLSAWLTKKERTCFQPGDSSLSVSFSAGKTDALVYVLMHEATHVVDDVLGLTDAGSIYFRTNSVIAGAFDGNIWLNDRTPVSQFRNSLLDSMRLRGGKPLPVAAAPRIYAAFQQTPFVSLYSMFSRSEDIADLFAVYYLTIVLGQPYAIEIKEKEKVVFRYEPAKSVGVRERFKYAELVFGSISGRLLK